MAALLAASLGRRIRLTTAAAPSSAAADVTGSLQEALAGICPLSARANDRADWPQPHPCGRWFSTVEASVGSKRTDAAQGNTSASSSARALPDIVQRYLNPKLLSSMEQHKLDLQRIRESFRMHNGDCGSTPVQIALLTERIRYMGLHLKNHRKDKHSRLGLDNMLAKRRKLLKYLRHKDWDSYCDVISRLGLRDRVDLQR